MIRRTKLGDVLRLHRGYDITKAIQRPGPYPIVSSSGISSYHDAYKFLGPGVVIGRKGSLGTAFYMSSSYWPHDTTLYVEDFKGNNPRYCYYLLKTMHLERFDVGAANPTLNRNHVHELEVDVVDVATQLQIASFLSAYDDLIENNTRRIAILEEMARLLFEEWFVQFQAPGHEGLPLIDSPLGPIPQGWEVTRLDAVIAFDPRVRVPKDGLNTFVPMTSLQTRSMILGEFEIKKGNSGSKFQNGDTLLARITPCLENGKTGFVDNLLTDDAVACGSTEFIVMRGVRVPAEFVQLLARNNAFRAHAIRSMSGATGRQRVRRESLEQYEIAKPDDKTLNRFASLMKPMFKLCRKLADANSNLRVQRDLLLPKLISGEIDVSEAEELMEAAE